MKKDMLDFHKGGEKTPPRVLSILFFHNDIAGSFSMHWILTDEFHGEDVKFVQENNTGWCYSASPIKTTQDRMDEQANECLLIFRMTKIALVF